MPDELLVLRLAAASAPGGTVSRVGWDEREHPRVPHGRGGGRFTSKPGGGGVTVGLDELPKALELWFHPVRMEARTVKHPKTGYDIRVGPELRVFHPEGEWRSNDEPVKGPAVFQVWEHPGLRPFPDGVMFARKRGTQPIESVYRGMSVAEFEQARKRGFFQSDRRGVIADWEGTNASADPRDAVSYLPRDVPAVIVKLRVRAADKWFTIGADQYLRTGAQVPFSQVEAVSPVLSWDGGRLAVAGKVPA